MIRILVLRDNLLTANQRLHWREKADRTRAIRSIAYYEAGMTNRSPAEREGGPLRCVVTIHYPDRRRRDAHNLMPTVKAAVDGIVDTGRWIPDDSNKWLIGPDLRVSADLCDKKFGCVLDFRFEPA